MDVINIGDKNPNGMEPLDTMAENIAGSDGYAIIIKVDSKGEYKLHSSDDSQNFIAYLLDYILADYELVPSDKLTIDFTIDE